LQVVYSAGVTLHCNERVLVEIVLMTSEFMTTSRILDVWIMWMTSEFMTTSRIQEVCCLACKCSKNANKLRTPDRSRAHFHQGIVAFSQRVNVPVAHHFARAILYRLGARISVEVRLREARGDKVNLYLLALVRSSWPTLSR